MAQSARKRATADAAAEDSARRLGKDERSRFPLTISRPELLVGGNDRDFRHLVHALFGFFARHERIRAGHAKRIGLAGIEYTVLISIGHLSTDGDVSVKRVADHLHLSGAFITSTVSAKGNALLERLAPSQRQVNDVEFGCLSREEFRFLIDVTDRLIASGDRAVALQTYLLSQQPGG
jgi:hypothetical protein